MNRIRTAILVGAAGVGLVMASTGCSVVNTAPDQIALHYTGGSFSSQKFQECVPTGTRQVNGPGEHYFYYPAGQRSFKFSSDDGADAAPLTASTKDQQELVVRGTITFTLNTSCKAFTDKAGKKWPGGKLQKFHDTIGRKFSAYATDGDVEPGEGWDRLLGTYIRDIADRAIDNEALKYGWTELYNDAGKKAQWEKDVIAAIPTLVKQQAGEDFFSINNVVLQKPDIAQELKAQLNAKQAAELRAQAAEVDKRTAQTWPGGINAYLAYQRQLAINEAIRSGRVKVIPVPDGANLLIPAS